jgi:radical SAM enzyme (TIGR01210 family)
MAAIPKLLSDLGLALQHDRPLVPASIGHRIVVAEPGRRFAQIWLRTRGCRHDILRGGCTICNYWASTPPSPDEIVKSMEAALDELQFDPATVVLSASGSVLDPWEIERNARRRVLAVLREHCSSANIIIETHPETVTTDSVSECSRILGPQWTIEMGLESATKNILHCCLNKPLTPAIFLRALNVIRKTSSVSTIANVALGAPFLTSEEIIADATTTVAWAFEHGVDECVLFPMNLKPHTLAHWLAGRSLYVQPSLWVLVDVLKGLPVKMLPRVNFAWHRVDRGYNSTWDAEILPPKTCDACHGQVISALDAYLAGGIREEIVDMLSSCNCPCRINWRDTNQDSRPLAARLLHGYQIAANEILGEDYWDRYGTAVREEVAQLFPGGKA